MKDQQTQFSQFAKMIQKDLEKYKTMYDSQMNELNKQIKDLPKDEKEVWTERHQEIKMHMKNQNTKGLLSVLDKIKSEIG